MTCQGPLRVFSFFYLRALLQRRPASSFAELQMVDGVQLPTFQPAATNLGVLRDHNEANDVSLRCAMLFGFGHPPALASRRYLGSLPNA